MKHISKYVKSVCLIAMCVALFLSSFACSKKTEKTGELADDYVPKVEGTVTLTAPIDVYSSDLNKQSIRNWVDNFKSQYPGVTVKEDFSDRGKYATRISAKDIGDVFWMADTDVYGYAVSNKSLMKLQVYAKKYEINMDDVYAGFKKLGEIGGDLYFIATNCGQQTFTYNKDMLEKEGLTAPSNDWTWDDFKSYISQLTKKNDDNTLSQVGAAMDVTNSPMYVPFFLGEGGQWCDTVNKKITLYSDEKVLDGFSELMSALENLYIYPNSNSGGGLTTIGEPYLTQFSNISANIEINSAFVQLDAYSNFYKRGNLYETNGVDWDVVAFPLFDYAASPCGSIGYGVFSYTDNPDTAAALCLSIYTEDGQTAINTGAGGSVPLLSSLADETFWHIDDAKFADKNYEAFTANTDMYVPSQVTCEVPQAVGKIIADGMRDLFTAFYSGGIDWKDSLNKIETQANEKWKDIL